MKLKFLSEDDLNSLKLNLPQIIHYFKQPDSRWLVSYFDRDPFLNTKYEINEFNLDMSQSKPFYTDFENVKRVYGQLKFLSDSQASDERLWAGLSLGYFWEYVQYRWDIKEKLTIDNVNQHFFFGFGSRRSLTRNALARLWWIGRLTTDFTRNDPFELTQIVCESSDNIMHIMERNFSNNKDILLPFLSALSLAKEEKLQINTDKVGELSKYLNLLGGTYLLDVLGPETIQNKVLNKAREISG
jgi:hypothetical protein